jgi:hypothetical protein
MQGFESKSNSFSILSLQEEHWDIVGSKYILIAWSAQRGDPLRWPRDTLYPQKLALTSPTSGGRSVGIVRLRTAGHGV